MGTLLTFSLAVLLRMGVLTRRSVSFLTSSSGFDIEASRSCFGRVSHAFAFCIQAPASNRKVPRRGYSRLGMTKVALHSLRSAEPCLAAFTAQSLTSQML